MSVYDIFFPSIFIGVNVTEVAHDYYAAVMNYVTEELGVQN